MSFCYKVDLLGLLPKNTIKKLFYIFKFLVKHIIKIKFVYCKINMKIGPSKDEDFFFLAF